MRLFWLHLLARIHSHNGTQQRKFWPQNDCFDDRSDINRSDENSSKKINSWFAYTDGHTRTHGTHSPCPNNNNNNNHFYHHHVTFLHSNVSHFFFCRSIHKFCGAASNAAICNHLFLFNMHFVRRRRRTIIAVGHCRTTVRCQRNTKLIRLLRLTCANNATGTHTHTQSCTQTIQKWAPQMKRK